MSNARGSGIIGRAVRRAVGDAVGTVATPRALGPDHDLGRALGHRHRSGCAVRRRGGPVRLAPRAPGAGPRSGGVAVGLSVLLLAGVYKPIWGYDARTLADDLSAHLVLGVTTSVPYTARTRRGS